MKKIIKYEIEGYVSKQDIDVFKWDKESLKDTRSEYQSICRLPVIWSFPDGIYFKDGYEVKITVEIGKVRQATCCLN